MGKNYEKRTLRAKLLHRTHFVVNKLSGKSLAFKNVLQIVNLNPNNLKNPKNRSNKESKTYLKVFVSKLCLTIESLGS